MEKSECSTFDVYVNGEIKGKVHDINPIVIANDEVCNTTLLKIKAALENVEPDCIPLLDKCLNVVNVKEDESVDFGPLEFVELCSLAQRHIDLAKEILACCEHITESLHFEGSFPDNFFLKAASTYGSLGTILEDALKMDPLNPNDLMDSSCSESFTDEEF